MDWKTIYFLIINIIGALAVILDKLRAKRGVWRISERALFSFCLLGGCPGVYLTMRAIRHKTLHKRFMWGIPLIFILQIVIIIAVFYKIYRGTVI